MPNKKEATSEGNSKTKVPVEKREKAIVSRKKESTFLFSPAARAILAETRVTLVDLEDRGEDYMLKAEMPGFKKEDIEIEVQEDSVEITGRGGWKYDKKAKDYICKERACESFYRSVQLPEEVKIDDVKANLTDGVLKVVVPKKAPKKARKISLK